MNAGVGLHSVEVVFLDQNKWIDLARVEAGKIGTGPLVELYSQLSRAVDEGRVIFPLTASHILETSKRNDPLSRMLLAQTQARLSKGYVYRSRAGRLLVEMRFALQGLFGELPSTLPVNWAVAPGFLQAFEPMDELVASPVDAERSRRLNANIDPRVLYVDYMQNQDDPRRRVAHEKLISGIAALVARIEARRSLLVGDSVDLRRRAYCAALFLDHQDAMIKVLYALGHTIGEMRALGPEAVINFIEDVPTLKVESEMAARLEASTGSIEPNDVFDMQSFYTAIPYSSRLVAEKGFISLAKQARLDVRYQVLLSRSLPDLLGVYA